MSSSSVALGSILSCFEGVVPSPVATCSADGTPNITYLSIVHYLDSERVALSRQFFNKTRANLDVNPYAQVLVVEPESFRQYRLDVRYMHTETEGPVFEAIKANLDAVASQSGMEAVFRLRGVDVYRVLGCAQVLAGSDDVHERQRSQAELVVPLDEFVRRVGACVEYEQAVQIALQALEDLFGFTQVILLLVEERGERLLGVASNGYPTSGAGAEVSVGEGLIGTAVERQRVICVPNLGRSRTMEAAVRASTTRLGTTVAERTVPLPGLPGAQSAAVVPLIAQGGSVGALYLESDRLGTFGPHNERLLRILGGHLATVLVMLEADASDRPAPEPVVPVTASSGADVIDVRYYQADDSLFVDGAYVTKGCPGRILWAMLGEHAASGRTVFTNRELRLDERLGLPAGANNLEARLLVLRKRLAIQECGVQLDRIARGQLALRLSGPVGLHEVPTSGPMRRPSIAASDPVSNN